MVTASLQLEMKKKWVEYLEAIRLVWPEWGEIKGIQDPGFSILFSKLDDERAMKWIDWADGEIMVTLQMRER